MSKPKLTPEQIDEACELRERGWSFERIGRKLHVSGKAISWHCLKLGAEPPTPTKLGSRGPAVVVRNGHQVRRFSAEEDRQLLEWRGTGVSINEISHRLERKHNSIIGRLYTLARYAARAEQQAA